MSQDGPHASSLQVAEIFLSIQGEATHVGRPCAFVRLTGCDLRCRWCDTDDAFQGGSRMTVAEVVRQVSTFGCPLVEVTGGEPLLQSAAATLVRELLDAGHEVLVETGGHRAIEVLDRRARIILDVKCPGSSVASHNRLENLHRLTARDAVKFVVADRADYEWARALILRRDLASCCPVYLSPVHGELDPARLAEWILTDRLPARLQVQLHKILWGAAARGV